MDVFDAISGRRSIRAFSKRSVEEEKLQKILASAILAPSEGNLQAWKFLVAKKEETRKGLARAAFGQNFIVEADVAIVVCADLQATASYGQRGKTLYCLQFTGAAIQNILLVAYAMGLGTCWVGAFAEEEVTRILALPQNLRPVAIIPVGYPEESPKARRRKPLEEVVIYL